MANVPIHRKSRKPAPETHYAATEGFYQSLLPLIISGKCVGIQVSYSEITYQVSNGDLVQFYSLEAVPLPWPQSRKAP